MNSKILNAREMALKLANCSGIDRWEKYLQDWLNSYTDRWKEEEKLWIAKQAK